MPKVTIDLFAYYLAYYLHNQLLPFGSTALPHNDL